MLTGYAAEGKHPCRSGFGPSSASTNGPANQNESRKNAGFEEKPSRLATTLNGFGISTVVRFVANVTSTGDFPAKKRHLPIEISYHPKIEHSLPNPNGIPVSKHSSPKNLPF